MQKKTYMQHVDLKKKMIIFQLLERSIRNKCEKYVCIEKIP